MFIEGNVKEILYILRKIRKILRRKFREHVEKS